MLLEELLNEYILELQIKNCSSTTIKSYKGNLSRFISFLEPNLELEEVKAGHIKEYIIHLQGKGLKATYINTVLKHIRGLFNYAVEEEYASINVASKVRWLKEITPVIETFNQEEIKAMLSYYKGKDFLSVRNKLVIYMLLDTGIRAGELTNIRVCDINGNDLLVHGKGGKERQLTLSPVLEKELLKYMRIRSCDSEYLFISYRGHKLTVESVEGIFKAMSHLVRPNIRCSPHTCRHTYSQLLLKAGVDSYIISRLLGHNSMTVTRRYLSSLPVKDINKLSISPIMAIKKG